MYSDISVSAGYDAGPYQAPIDAEPLLKRRRRGPLRLRKPRQIPRTETSRRVGNCHLRNITSESTYPLFFFSIVNLLTVLLLTNLECLTSRLPVTLLPITGIEPK